MGSHPKKSLRSREKQAPFTTMKAAFIKRTGAADVVIYGDLPAPEIGKTECLVRTGAVDVNPIDVYVRSGMIPAKLSFPFILGRDVAGTVEKVGTDVTLFKPGQRVWATNQGTDGRTGTFAEFVAVDEKWLYPSPANASDEEMAALSLVGMTACLGLTIHAQLKQGETLFVNGGSGGVGSCVVQMAKALGARVIATAGSDAKAQICRDLGADHVIRYKSEDVAETVRKLAPNGVNVWWETLREPDFARTVALLALRGRMILMAGREARPNFPVGPFYVKDCSLHGFAVFNSPVEEQRTAAGLINDWVGQGKLRARIDRVLPLRDAAEAHRLQEASTLGKTGELAGKIVLTP
jgi:NADPH:quinone reductase